MVPLFSMNRSSASARSAFRNSHIQKPLREYAATGITRWLWHKFSEPSHLEYKRIGEGACGVAYATSWPWKSMSWGEPGGTWRQSFVHESVLQRIFRYFAGKNQATSI